MQAIMREKATLREVERLQTAIRNLLEEAGQRTKTEVDVNFVFFIEKSELQCTRLAIAFC